MASLTVMSSLFDSCSIVFSVYDSITSGLLQHPVFTRSNTFRDWSVPEVLLSGNHGKIEQWRRRQSLARTLRNRPDLLAKADITEDDREYLRSLGYEATNYS